MLLGWRIIGESVSLTLYSYAVNYILTFLEIDYNLLLLLLFSLPETLSPVFGRWSMAVGENSQRWSIPYKTEWVEDILCWRFLEVLCYELPPTTWCEKLFNSWLFHYDISFFVNQLIVFVFVLYICRYLESQIRHGRQSSGMLQHVIQMAINTILRIVSLIIRWLVHISIAKIIFIYLCKFKMWIHILLLCVFMN